MNSSQLNPESRADLAQRTLNLLEAGEVVRFHAVPTITGQTVGHHSYGVAAILIAMGMMVDPEDRWVVSNAILHDAAELITGDMPFTVKRSSPDLKAHMDRMELQADMDHFLPQTRLSHRQELFLKLADMMEGLRWCLSGHERGKSVVSMRWTKAIDSLLLEQCHHFNEGEAERVWAVYHAVVELKHGSTYSTFDAFRAVHQPKTKQPTASSVEPSPGGPPGRVTQLTPHEKPVNIHIHTP